MKKFDEALLEVRRALELDPLSLIINRIYADVLMDARRYDEAIEQYRKTLELDPNFPTTHFFLGRAYEAKGMYDQAIEEYSTNSMFGADVVAKLKDTYPKSGWKGYVHANINLLEATMRQEQLPAYVMAGFYARVDQKEKALDYLEKAYVDRDFRLLGIGVSFEFDRLRSEPRFIELTKRVGLPE